MVAMAVVVVVEGVAVETTGLLQGRDLMLAKVLSIDDINKIVENPALKFTYFL